MKYKCRDGWTKQLMKDKIVEKNSGQKCEDWNGCLYTSKFGDNRCVVGVFIPDNHKGLLYSGEACDLFDEYPDLLKDMPLSANEMQTFQEIHDCLPRYRFIHHELFKWIDENVEDE